MSDIVKAIQAAKKADYDEVCSRIAEIQGELDTLNAVKRILSTKLQLQPTPEPRRAGGVGRIGSAAASPDMLANRRTKCVCAIAKVGRMTMQKLSDETGIARQGPSCLSQVVNCDLFHTSPDGVVSLTDAGVKAARLAG